MSVFRLAGGRRERLRRTTASAILVDDPGDDEPEREQSEHVDLVSRLDAGMNGGQPDPVRGQEPERAAEEQEQTVAAVSPVPKKNRPAMADPMARAPHRKWFRDV